MPMSEPVPDPPLPLLLTGIAGVAGYNAWRYFRKRFPGQVVAVRRVDYWPLAGEGIIPCDGDDRDQLERLFNRHQFRSVLNCEGTCKLKSCELDPAMARRINVESLQTLLDVIGGRGVRLVHLSIDLVYSGTRGGNHIRRINVESLPTRPDVSGGRGARRVRLSRDRVDAA